MRIEKTIFETHYQSMLKWYADDSALKKEYDGNKRSVFLFGGILISRENEIKLSNIIKEVKLRFTGENMPIKYKMIIRIYT